MSSLEFIEKEIKELEFQINYIKSNMEKYIDFRTEGQLEVDMKQLKLKYLQQIKSELEAWEVVKKKVKPVLKMDKEDYQPAYYWWIAEEIINLDTLDYQKLKNALEVER